LLGMAGCMAAVLQLGVLPSLLHRFKSQTVFTFLIGFWPVAFLMLPILNLIARSGFDEAAGIMHPSYQSVIWVGVCILLALARAGWLAYSYVFSRQVIHRP
jgi:hypothetical protein